MLKGVVGTPTTFFKATFQTWTILGLVIWFQAIETKSIFPGNFSPLLQVLGLENGTVGNRVFVLANNTLLFS